MRSSRTCGSSTTSPTACGWGAAAVPRAAGALPSVPPPRAHEEALALADRVTVMRSGHVLQVGPADELWERPRTRAVATALGEANVLRATIHLWAPGGASTP